MIGHYIPGCVGGRKGYNGTGGWEGRIRDYIYECLAWRIVYCGRNGFEVVLGTLSRDGWDGGPGKMARVCVRLGLSNITWDHFVCGLGNVDRPRAKEGLGTISRAGCGFGSRKMSR
jgi:hypothetical protein